MTRRLQPLASLSALVIFALITAAACTREPPPPDPSPSADAQRTAPAGELVGFHGRYGSHVWMGIPYARPPVGELRWRAPEPAPRWDGVRKALEAGSPCPQLASSIGGIVDQERGTFVGDEDCLFLNVYAPSFAESAIPRGQNRLPVMVWIHGGGNVVGHSTFYDGGNLAQRQNVVVVTLNYRLGPLGWFRHAALRADASNAREASGNLAILDQILALEWVQKNISAFGGNPGNVTIFGESAGARNVLALLLSPLAKDLFHRAISQSGSARELVLDRAENFSDAPEPGLAESSNEIIARLLISNGRAQDRDGAKAALSKMAHSEVAALLRGTRPDALIAAYQTEEGEGLIHVPNVFGDGVVLPKEPPLERFATPGGFNRVPILLGTNRDEVKTFLIGSPKHVRRWLPILPRLRDEANYLATAALETAAWKLVGVDAPAEAILRSGWPEVYAYRWDWDEEPTLLGADLSMMLGAGHGLEIPFVFGHYELGPRGNVIFTSENAPGREQLSAQMMSYWAEFARSGRPGRGVAGDMPEWTAWDAGSPSAAKFMILDTQAGGGARMSSDVMTARSVVAQAESDPNLGSGEARCDVYRELKRRLSGLDAKFEAFERDCSSSAVADAAN